MIKITDTRYIESDLHTILDTIRTETIALGDMYLKDIVKRGQNFTVTCPYHGDHSEKKPACTVFGETTGTFNKGDFHCLVCGESGNIVKFTSTCLNVSPKHASEWLLEGFRGVFMEHTIDLPSINLNRSVITSNALFLNENILEGLQEYHPYMTQRKLSPEVCKTFKVKYDPKTQSIVFPVYDDVGRLYMLTRRSVVNKSFYIDEGKEKPVYLLHHIREHHIPYAVVCESQINTLTLLSQGVSAIGLFGANFSNNQMELLNKSGIRHYILAFDGDRAGDIATKKFLKHIRKDVFVDILRVPRGKDINDLSPEEIKKLFVDAKLDYDNLRRIYWEKTTQNRNVV